MHGRSVEARMEPRSEIRKIARKFTESSFTGLGYIVERAHFEAYDIGVAHGKRSFSEGQTEKIREINAAWKKSGSKTELEVRANWRESGIFQDIPKSCSAFVKKMARTAFYEAYYEGYGVWTLMSNYSKNKLRTLSWEESDAFAEIKQIRELAKLARK